jgi:DNA invertase Pin-like site-specific DNA recombinase
VGIHYATGAGDPATAEGQIFIGMQQLWDEFERKLARETKRGMREGTEQGYSMGGRAPTDTAATCMTSPKDTEVTPASSA